MNNLIIILIFIFFSSISSSFAQAGNNDKKEIPTQSPLNKEVSEKKGDDVSVNSPKKNVKTDAIIDKKSFFENGLGKEVLDKDGKSLKGTNKLFPESTDEPQYPASEKPIKVSKKNCPFA